MIDNEWEEPENLEAAVELKRVVIGEIEEIQAQLGDRVRQHNSEFETYYKWRQGAKWALTSRLQELRLVKKWISQHQADYKESEPIAH